MLQISFTSSAYFGLIRSLAFYESLFLTPYTHPLVSMFFIELFFFFILFSSMYIFDISLLLK